MDDLAEQIRAWADAAAERTGEPVSAAEAMDGHRRLPERSAPTSRMPSTRRLVLTAAAVFVVLAGAAMGIATLRRDRRDDVSRVRTGPPKSTRTDRTTPSQPRTTDRISFRVLAVHQAAQDQLGRLGAATAPDELSRLWAEARLAPPSPAIDFSRQVVVSITIPGSDCPPVLDGFDRRLTTLQPRFIQPPCNQPLIPRTYVAALDWSTTGPVFWLHLRGQPRYGFSDSTIRIKMRKPTSTIYDSSGLEEDLRRTFPETVVGAYYDARTLVVSVTAAADHDAIQREIDSYNSTQSSVAPPIRLAIVDNPRARLDTLMAKALRADDQMLRWADDVNSIGVDPESGTLRVGLLYNSPEARAVVLDVLHAKPTEISFTQQDVVPAAGGGN